MTTDPNEANPYRSPMAAIRQSEAAVTTPAAVQRRFRWRVVPVTLLYMYGGGLVLVGLESLGLMLWFTLARGEGSPLRRGNWLTTACMLAVGPAMFATGLLFLFAGRNLWQARWRRGIVATLLAITICAGAGAIAVWCGL
jgi:hypothetical protein